jgi:hypothetical protein
MRALDSYGKLEYSDGGVDTKRNSTMSLSLSSEAVVFEAIANRTICSGLLRDDLADETRDARFKDTFGVSSRYVSIIWRHINDPNEESPSPERKHLLWTSLFLKTYATQETCAMRCGVSKKTYGHWAWKVINKLAALEVVSGNLVEGRKE